MSKFWIGFITFIITAGIAGGATYYFVGHQEQGSKDSLNNQISALQDEVTGLTKQLNSTKGSNSSATNSTTETSACQSSNLLASLTNGDGTAGTYYYTLNLKNNGSSACNYSGTTTVSLLDKTGNSLGSTTINNSSAITLNPGSSIYSAVGFPDAGAADNCTIGVTTLAVYPSGQSTAITVNGLDTLNSGFTNYYCSQFSIKAFSATNNN